jgi:uncharacterized membrane protein
VNETASPLDKTVEVVLTCGLAVSALLLVAGLFIGAHSLLQAGILLLMLTPLARVVVVTVGLFHEGDRLFGTVSLCILLVLVGSVIVATRL